MLELKDEEGNAVGRTFGGHTLIEACRTVLAEFGPSEVIAMLPAATRDPDSYAILSFTSNGRVKDTGLRLVGTEG